MSITTKHGTTSAEPAAATPPRRSPRRGGVRRTRFGYLAVFLGPWTLGFLVLTAGPLLASVYLSLTDFNLLGNPTFIGAENYVQMFTADPRFFTSLGVTAMYVVVSVPLQLLLALGLALLLNQGVRGLSYYRALYYLPSLIGGSVAIGILWRTVFGYQGSVNQVLRLLGFEDLPNWVNNPTWSIWTLIALNVWTFGSPMIIFLAGLRQIPAELYEQAQIDGAGAVARFLKITLPMLTPLIFFNVILQTINAFQAFTPAHVISNGTSGPADSTMFYTLYLYIEGFTRYNMGYASALGCILLALIGILTLLNFLFSRYWVFYND
ncbi:MAG TPA: sugar ABC transporter permease [Micromonosporaceae bacterium]|nr:sugar ABC transporter permease [Micromonosporaceae bacterium]